MRKMVKKFTAVILAFALAMGAVAANSSQIQAYSVSSNMKWWANDRFGMFIHFGAYSCLGKGEWAMNTENISKKDYQEKVAAKFNPANFNAKTIVSYAKKAGMKYLVITAKHHEGLAMWDTKVAGFKNLTGTKTFSLQGFTPFGSTGRDVLMELKDACDEAGIKFGLYYSILDWNHSSQKINDSFTTMSSMEARANYIKDMKEQLQELVTKYNPAIMWFDGDWTRNNGAPTLKSWWTKADGKDLYKYMKQISPDIIVNERVFRGSNLGDFACPEQSIPAAPMSRSWETCQTMNPAWGYNKSLEKQYRTNKAIVQELSTVVSRDGNYLLNIGPKGDGTMTAGSKKILNGMANWMKTSSESIYGNTRSPFKDEPDWGVYTRKGNTVYAHVYKWPKTKKLVVKQYKSKKIKSITVLANDKKLKYSVKKKKVTIKVPKTAPNSKDTVIKMEYKA